ncbi:Rrf2 family transcriptional regulator [Tepidamorphus sp. 3E244]|uniref:Rrf2 family transcriptional regulator n=1 Tax=Tepidamorphus sp. 3E244 TaxID=3385498 RepID=UPI0038FD1CE6
MRLTEQTRYAVRVVAYCAAHHPERVRAHEIADALGLTEFTVFKLLKTARDANLLDTTRGRQGGIRLGFDPALMSVGQIVRAFEPRFQQCGPAALFGTDDGGLEPYDFSTSEAFGRGVNAFLGELDTIRITDLLAREEMRGGTPPATESHAGDDR